MHCHSRHTFVRFDVLPILWADLPALFLIGLSDSLDTCLDTTSAALAATTCPSYQCAYSFPLRRHHAVKEIVWPVLQWQQIFVGLISHAFLPFYFPLQFFPKKVSRTIPVAYSGVGKLPRTSESLVPKWSLNKASRSWLLVVLSQLRYSFSGGHWVFKVLSIEELI